MKRTENGAIGRILSATLKTARAEFVADTRVEEGAFICLKIDGKQRLGRIDKLETHRYAGLTGYLYWIDPLTRPPRAMQYIYLAQDDAEDGILYIGRDRKAQEIKLSLNPFYQHVLVAGMTQQGKTHLCIIFLEEMIERGVPCLVIDSHGEFVNLVKEYRDKAFVVENIRIEDLIAHLQQRHTVIYNLLGLHKVSKANRVGEILAALMMAKEKDYAQAGNQIELLQIPPVMVILDEAEIYAPNKTSRYGVKAGGAIDAVVSIAKEGAKFGLGLVAVPQRVTKLDVDVRGQMNSAAIFRLTDSGSRLAVKKMDFIADRDVKALGSFSQGICLLSGSFVRRPRVIVTRDIKTEKVKKVDFEEILGISPKLPKLEYAAQFVRKEDDLVDPDGDIVEHGIQKLTREDRAAYDAAQGDGVIERSHISPEEQITLKKLRKPDEHGERLIG